MRIYAYVNQTNSMKDEIRTQAVDVEVSIKGRKAKRWPKNTCKNISEHAFAMTDSQLFGIFIVF